MGTMHILKVILSKSKVIFYLNIMSSDQDLIGAIFVVILQKFIFILLYNYICDIFYVVKLHKKVRLRNLLCKN